MPTVGIVGTAGRLDDTEKMSKELFESMVERAAQIIEHEFHLDWKDIDLVSGGAAWSDHIAVVLYLRKHPKSCKLFVPAAWNNKNPADPHYQEGTVDVYGIDAGKNMNMYHRQFSAKIGYDSMEEIEMARKSNGGASGDGETGGVNFAIDSSHRSFGGRNSAIATAYEFLIAFSWGDGAEPKEGGTLDTWNKCKSGRKVHVRVASLQKA